MKDSRTITGDLMEEGVFVWCVFMPDGKASLHMNSEQYPDSRTHSRGRLLSPDVSVLHEILTPDDADRFLSLPEYGISIRIRMRVPVIREQTTRKWNSRNMNRRHAFRHGSS